MSLRRIALICASAAGLALAGAASAQPLGHPLPHAGPGMSPGMSMPAAPALPSAPYPGAPPLPSAPDMRPAWQGAAQVLMPDARTRDAWLSECHRRTSMYYGGYRKSRRHRDDWRRDDRDGRDRAYSYCEAYFDDYYRTYRAHGHVVYAHAPMMMAHAPMAPAAKQNCVETETVEYVPVRTRVIPRRPAPRRVVPDKRVRDKRMLMD